MQGPSRRPAVFSHDKLLWRCCEEVVSALNATNKQPTATGSSKAASVEVKQSKITPEEQAIQKEIKRLTGRPASNSLQEIPSFTPAAPKAQATLPAQQPSQRDLALLALGLKPATSSHSTPKTVSVHVKAHVDSAASSGAAAVARQIGLTQAELGVLLREVEKLVVPELKLRAALRAAGIREAPVTEAAMTPADGDLPSCHWCGHAPFLSYVKCSCR